MNFKKAKVITQNEVAKRVKLYCQCDACGMDENLEKKSSKSMDDCACQATSVCACGDCACQALADCAC